MLCEMLSYHRDTIRRVGSKIVQVQMVECSTCQKGRQIDDSFSEKFRVSELHDIMLLCSTILKTQTTHCPRLKNAELGTILRYTKCDIPKQTRVGYLINIH